MVALLSLRVLMEDVGRTICSWPALPDACAHSLGGDNQSQRIRPGLRLGLTIGLALSSAAVLDLESGVVRVRLDYLDERLRQVNQIVSSLQMPTEGRLTICCAVAHNERRRSENVSIMVKTLLLPLLTLRRDERESGGKKGPCVYEDSLATQTQLAKVCSPTRASFSTDTRPLKYV